MAIKIRSVKVEPITKDVDFRSRLVSPKMFIWLKKPIISDEEVEPEIRDIPTIRPDGTEIVDWMIDALKAAIPLDVMTTSVAKAGGVVVSKSGDPYIPGVSAGKCKVLSWTGRTVKEKGYGVVTTPVGDFQVPLGKAVTFTKGDVLAWAANLSVQIKQWVMALINWLKPPQAPIENRIPFAVVSGFTAPQFVAVSPNAPVPLALLRIGMTSEKDQKVSIKLRGPEGKYQNVLDQTEVQIPAGQSETLIWVTNIPYVTNFTLHIQPQNGVKTVIDYVKLIP